MKIKIKLKIRLTRILKAAFNTSLFAYIAIVFVHPNNEDDYIMKIAFYDVKPYDLEYFNLINKQYCFDIKYIEGRLDKNTAASQRLLHS